MKGCTKNVKTKVDTSKRINEPQMKPSSAKYLPFFVLGRDDLSTYLHTIHNTRTYAHVRTHMSGWENEPTRPRRERIESFPPRRDSFQRTRGAFLPFRGFQDDHDPWHRLGSICFLIRLFRLEVSHPISICSSTVPSSVAQPSATPPTSSPLKPL